MNSDSEEPEVDEATQAVYWKLEAIMIKAMKANQIMTHDNLVAHTLHEWQALGRPEPVGPELVLNRLAYLMKREWFTLDQATGNYQLKDLTK